MCNFYWVDHLCLQTGSSPFQRMIVLNQPTYTYCYSVRLELMSTELDFTYTLIESIPIIKQSSLFPTNITINVPTCLRLGQSYYLTVAANDGPHASLRTVYPGAFSHGLTLPSSGLE